MDPVLALRACGGAARWGDLVAVGVQRRSLAAALRCGDVVRRLYGTYALPSAARDVWLASAYRAQLTCLSLCDQLGLPLLQKPRLTHLLVPDSRALRADDRRPRNLVVWHRADDAWSKAGDDAIAVAVDMASRCLDRFGQLALVDAALRAKKLFPADIWDFRETGVAQRRWLADRADWEAQSIMESYARAWLTDAGFMVKPQVVVGGEGHRDLLVEGCVVVELDGYDTHGNPKSFRQDRARDRRAVHAGKVTLRYTFADLFGSDRADLVADVEAALRLIRKGV